MDLTFRSAGDLLRMIRDGEISARALLEHYIERIERLNPSINAVVVKDFERARKRADEADAALSRGENWGPLHGLPMTVKETYEVAGLLTTAGAPELKDYRSSTNAVAVQRLIDAGAVIFGKTNVPLYAGDLQSYNEIYGTTNNPWDLKRTPGGSSGGAAAALAAGFTPLELGSDIGGSIRTPAAFCGVCGHKPSWGLIPHRGHIPGPPGSLMHRDIAVMGPLARTAGDLEMAMDLLVGPDSDEAVAWEAKLPPARWGKLSEYRVAAWLNDEACPVESEVVETLEGLVGELRREGVSVDETARPEGIELGSSYDIYYRLLTSAMSAGLPRKVFDRMLDLAHKAPEEDCNYSVRFARGATIMHSEWLKLNEKRLHLRKAWETFFENFDVMICPVVHTLPFLHDHSHPVYDRTLTVNGKKLPYMDILTWVGFGGVVHLPATVIPVGRTRSGLPVAVQIIGPYLEDRTPLDFARHLEKLTGGFVPPPGY